MTAEFGIAPTVSTETAWWLGSVLILYVCATYALSFWIKGRISSAEDFIVAGRRLPLSLCWATLMATWFGAGTVLTAADEVRVRGLKQIALEPLGSGFCLLVAGFFFARRLWDLQVLTLPDVFRRQFGRRAEIASALIMVPSFFGWIAVQFLALAEMLHLFFGLDVRLGLLLVAVVGGGYTWLGGMWSVTLTDAFQISLVLIGTVYLGFVTLSLLGKGAVSVGLTRLLEETPTDFLQIIPSDTWEAVLGWFGIFCVAALGNVASQDLTQRIFSARSARVAQRACWLAGLAYVGFGMVPVLLGLASRILFPEEVRSAILPALAHAFLGTFPAVVFTLVLTSAILSTIDSAILAPAAVLGQNLFTGFSRRRLSQLALTRLAVLFVTAASLILAYLGESAYSLLEEAYALPLVGLFVPLTLGLFRPSRTETPALSAMFIGVGLWLIHHLFGWEHFLPPLFVSSHWKLPVALASSLAGLVVYLLVESAGRRNANGSL